MKKSELETPGTSPSINSVENYERSLQAVGYVPRSEATVETYRGLGFKCGLEIHQQLLTEKKLFCHCPAGIYQQADDYDAEVIRHMRPTLSEMGEYDGTALMEKKTRKNITYRLKNKTACTYEIDDTPPFLINQQALDIAIDIALLLQTNVVGELHITRKQYLDGSIPTGFQRTAIVGVEGEIPIKGKKIGIIQISVEEDSCREVSDIGHDRIYMTDRLGMPLVETVTYPHMLTPDEAAEAAQYLRLLTRATGKVRTGIGAARQDVNVSITGGTRVEIKGVSHIKWIPNLTHGEAFRQKALLAIRDELSRRPLDNQSWRIGHECLDWNELSSLHSRIAESGRSQIIPVAVNLPGFAGILSHFTQPGMTFENELADRLKVIACLERPNSTSSESLDSLLSREEVDLLRRKLGSRQEDAQFVFWAEEPDIQTALETIEERCLLAFDGIPNETRKALTNGLTIFERVLPGPDRMYPDTDSVPIAIRDERIERRRGNLPQLPSEQFAQLEEWGIPQDCFRYLLRHRLIDDIDQIARKTGWPHKFLATLVAHDFSGQIRRSRRTTVAPRRVLEVCAEAAGLGVNREVVKELIPLLTDYPEESASQLVGRLQIASEPIDIDAEISRLSNDFQKRRRSHLPGARHRWLMGQLKPLALGKILLKDLSREIKHYG